MTKRPVLTRPTWDDLAAGISVALVLVPQALAYASLAGLPPVHGLYAAAVAPIAAALVGSSPYLQTGPVALTSLLTFGALAPLAASGQVGSATFAAHGALLALMVGAIRLLLGLLRWGGLAYFMSLPVVTGFTVAAALLIICAQIPGLVGVAPRGGNPPAVAASALSQPQRWSAAAIVIGLATIAVVITARQVRLRYPRAARLPWVLLAMGAALVVTRLGLVTVPQIGAVPSGLPTPQLGLPWTSVPSLLVPAVLIALVGFAEPASIARRYAAEDRRPWNPDREFIGQGLANAAAGCFGGYPVGGSFSRSALNRAAGARTRWSGAVAGLAVLAVLPVAGPLESLPTAVLAGVVIATVLPLVDLSGFRDYWRYSRAQFLVALPTLVVTLATAPQVERGLLVGVGLALVVHLWRETRIHVTADHQAGTLYLRPEGVLYFASTPVLDARLAELLDRHERTSRVVVDLSRLGRLDLTGLLALRDFAGYAADRGAQLELRGVPTHARERVQRVFGEGDTGVTISPGE